MKKTLPILWFSILFFLTCINFTFSQTTKDYFQLGSEIKFSSEKYNLTRSIKPYNNYFIQEYIRPNEDTKNFTKSLVILAIIDTTSVDQLLDLKIKDFKKIKEKNNTLVYEILLNDEGGRMVEFTLNDTDFVYWNIQRFDIQKTQKDETIGVIYSYVEKRAITKIDTVEKITKSIKEKRVNFITEVGDMIIPKIVL